MDKLFIRLWASLMVNKNGATAAEYGLLVALIAVAITAAVTLFGTTLAGLFTTVTNTIKG